MTLKICDLSWGKPLPSLLAAAGINAACLYVGQDSTGKNMNAPYVTTLAGLGLWTVTNFEYGASQMLGGFAQGVTDARLGLSQARACGMPPGRPIYYSADFDASAAQMADAVIPYLQGARSVTGPGTVGFYGGYPQVVAVLEFWAQTYPGERVYIWQTPAWSGGQWSASADIRQQVAQETVGGGPIDIDYAYSPDFGQWQPGITPGGDMDWSDVITGPNGRPNGNSVADILTDLGRLRDAFLGDPTALSPYAANSPLQQLFAMAAANVPTELASITAEVGQISAPSIDPAALAAAVKAALTDPAVLKPLAHAVAVELHNDTPAA